MTTDIRRVVASKKWRLAWDLARVHLVNGTGRPANDMKAVAHYRAILARLEGRDA